MPSAALTKADQHYDQPTASQTKNTAELFDITSMSIENVNSEIIARTVVAGSPSMYPIV